MTDEDAMLEAIILLDLIARHAGGFVSPQQRERIKVLGKHAAPIIKARMQRWTA